MAMSNVVGLLLADGDGLAVVAHGVADPCSGSVLRRIALRSGLGSSEQREGSSPVVRIDVGGIGILVQVISNMTVAIYHKQLN
mmetsp:Transcript_5195/g.10589  ORF Transcript_5195/g.10589 Transcript_5195/m.10589 type:complete len:83 (-) Transcript_5195:2059-2307(-)